MLPIAILFCIGIFNALAIPVEKNVQVKGDSSYLLPDNVILPQNYKITIDVSKSFENIKERKFTGSVVITAKVNADVEEITLHSADIVITGNIKVEDNNGIQYYKNHKIDQIKQFLTLNLDKVLNKEQIITITISSYDGKLQDNMYGFYVSEYVQKNDPNPKYVLTTQFQPTHARKAFPCFDEPKYKAEFELTFKKEAKYKVISNMPSGLPDHGSGLTEVSFPVTPKMSTYLVAFIVHQLDSTPSPDDIEYNVWSRPDAKEQTKWAASNMHKIVKELIKFTGINYEDYVPKMDMAALPDFAAGAMENWGLLTYRETALLVDEKLSTNKDIQRVVSVISHEVAHQWFGDLVTTAWWSNTWLNEGFATYFEYHTTGNVTQNWEMKDQFVVEQLQSVFGVDALAKTTPLTLAVFTPAEISSHFGSISYNKGGSVIRMMEHFLGSHIFQKGLQHYLHQNRLSYTVPENLWSAIQTIVDENNVNVEYKINEIMSSWISQAGYPVVNVKSAADGNITFSQKRFYLNSEDNKSNKLKWFVPISYTTSKDLDFTNLKPKLWLTPNKAEEVIPVGNDIDFIVVNIQETGYYRVNYDDVLWEKLAGVLPEEKGKQIHYMNRAQIVDDVLNLARAGLVDYEVAFNVTDYLATETNYYPWYSAFQAFRYLLQRYSDTENTGTELREYLKELIELLVKDKEFVDVPKETQVQVLNRVAALDWACNLGLETCVTQAQTLFKEFKDNNKEIPKNLKSIVYCTALRNGDKTDWDFLWEKFGTSNSAAEKIGIINALGCSNDEAILKDFLAKSISSTSGIRKQDASYVFTSVYTGNTKGVDVAFNFLKNNHEAIKENYGGMNALEKGVLGLGGRLTDKTQIEEYKTLLKSDGNFATFRDAAIETVDQNVAWADKYSDIIGNILNKKRTGSAAGIIANKYVIIFLGFISIYFSFFN